MAESVLHDKVEVRVKVTLCLIKYHVKKAYWKSGVIAPRILHFSTRCGWVVSFTRRSLYIRGKSPSLPP